MKKGFRIIKFKKDKPIFQLKDISKSFDGRPILKKISIEMFPGEIVGLLGPNGSGKSTLYSTIIGENSPDTGKIFLSNENILEKNEKEMQEIRGNKISMIFLEVLKLGSPPVTNVSNFLLFFEKILFILVFIII